MLDDLEENQRSSLREHRMMAEEITKLIESGRIKFRKTPINQSHVVCENRQSVSHEESGIRSDESMEDLHSTQAEESAEEAAGEVAEAGEAGTAAAGESHFGSESTTFQ